MRRIFLLVLIIFSIIIILPLITLSTEIDRLVEKEIYRLEVEVECDSCPHTVEPVCASNGKTFENICDLMCEGAVFLHIGNCMLESVGVKEEIEWGSRQGLLGVNAKSAEGLRKMVALHKLSKRGRLLPIEMGRYA